MDEPSRNVVRFIEALSSHVWGDVLYGGQDGLWMKLVRRGLKPTRPGMTISIGTGPPVSLILSIVAKLGPERELHF